MVYDTVDKLPGRIKAENVSFFVIFALFGIIGDSISSTYLRRKKDNNRNECNMELWQFQIYRWFNNISLVASFVEKRRLVEQQS